MAKCINCNEIELKNPKAKYCSDKCRMAFKRRAINLNKAVFGPQPEQRTRTERNPNKPCDTPDVIPKQDKDIKTITFGDQAKSMKTMAMLHSDACKQGVTEEVIWESEPGASKKINEIMRPKQGSTSSSSKPKPQSHNPMMVGYVPPKE